MLIEHTVDSIIHEGEPVADFKNKRIVVSVDLLVSSKYASKMEVSKFFELNQWKEIKKLRWFLG